MARLVAVNLAVLAALLAVANLASGLALAGRSWWAGGLDERRLVAYADAGEARRLLEEFEALPPPLYRSYVGWKREPHRGATITVNEDGDRVHPASPAPAAPVVRFFGGSTIWGTGAADDETIPALFDRLRPGARVVNHGEAAYTARQGLARLVNELVRGGSAALVVFYDGTNDVRNGCRRDSGPLAHAREGRVREALEDREARESVAGVLRGTFLDHTAAFVARARLRSNARRDPDTYGCAADARRAEAVAQALVGSWRVARTLVEARGGRFLAVLQPVAWVGAPRLEHLGDVFRREGDLRREYAAVYPRVRAAIAGDRGLVDLSHAFDGVPRLYIDAMHVTAAGNARIARAIADLAGAGSWPAAGERRER